MTMADEKEVDKVFKQHKLIPDVVSVAPNEFLKVTYAGELPADRGNELTPTQVKATPKVEWSADENAFYTLIMTDPDAPSRKEPKFREYHHWLVVNIPGCAVERGEVLTSYIGSGPPQGTGLHRYVFLVFRQMAKLKCRESKIPQNSGKNRANFSTMKFAKEYKLGQAIAGNFYQAQWDDYVPTVHRQLQGK